MIRRLKSVVLDQLPPKRRTCIKLPQIGDDQLKGIQAGFEELERIGRDADAGRLDKGRVLSAMYVQTGSAKLPGVTEYVKELCSSNVKFIVFAHHKEVVRALQTCVEKEKVGYMVITGDTPADERRAGVERFQNPSFFQYKLVWISFSHTYTLRGELTFHMSLEA